MSYSIRTFRPSARRSLGCSPAHALTLMVPVITKAFLTAVKMQMKLPESFFPIQIMIREIRENSNFSPLQKKQVRAAARHERAFAILNNKCSLDLETNY